MQYLPPNEVPTSKKRHSLGPTNSHVMETPSPILYKRSRTDMEGVEMSSAKRQKAEGDEKVSKMNSWYKTTK